MPQKNPPPGPQMTLASASLMGCRLLCLLAASLTGTAKAASGPAALTAPDGRQIVWITFGANTDPVALAARLTALQIRVVQLAPEGRLLVAMPPEAAAVVDTLPGVVARTPFSQVDTAPADGAVPERFGMGDRPPTPEEEEYIRRVYTEVTAVEPNTLARARSQLEGLDGLPTSVDNSLSQYFPPIRSQGTQGSCTAWAACYYYNTFTQARDENLTVSGGNNNYINSPAFMYPLVNGGIDAGASTPAVVARLNEVGCCSWTTMPFSQSDWTTWPTEAAWVEAFRNRGQSALSIDGRTTAGLDAIKQHLVNGDVAAARFDIYQTWYSGYPNNNVGINNKVYYMTNGAPVGGHAVTLVGYDDNRTYVDHRDGLTKSGAFLLANSWGSTWGTYNSTGTGSKGFFWVAYAMFLDSTFGPYAYYNSDRDNYRPRLYAATGLNHPQRGRVSYTGGAGTAAAALWSAYYPISYAGGTNIALADTKRVAVDLTDGIASVQGDPRAGTYHVKATISSLTTSTGTLTSASFYQDFDTNGSFAAVASKDPPLSIPPNQTKSAEASFEAIKVSPASLTASGPQGGPFAISPTACTLTNTGEASLVWLMSHTQSWCSASPTTGTLAAGLSTNILVSINAAANSLPTGNYVDTLMFSNATSGVLHTRPLSLSVLAVASMPFSETFESGAFQPVWTVTGTGPFRSVVTSSNTPHAGTRHVVMDSTTTIYARNEVTLAVNLDGYSNVVLSFWAKEFGDEPHGPPSSPFVGGADFDGVAISQDGSTWYEVQALRSLTATYTQFTVNLDTAIAACGLSYNTAFRIRFNQYDNYPVTSDGIAFDDVSITGIAPFRDADADGMDDAWEIAHGLNPNDLNDANLDRDGDGMSNLHEYLARTDPCDCSSRFFINSVAIATGQATLRFQAHADITYQVEYSTNLVHWSPLPNGLVSGIEGTATVADPNAGTNPRRFYRACVQP